MKKSRKNQFAGVCIGLTMLLTASAASASVLSSLTSALGINALLTSLVNTLLPSPPPPLGLLIPAYYNPGTHPGD